MLNSRRKLYIRAVVASLTLLFGYLTASQILKSTERFSRGIQRKTTYEVKKTTSTVQKARYISQVTTVADSIHEPINSVKNLTLELNNSINLIKNGSKPLAYGLINSTHLINFTHLIKNKSKPVVQALSTSTYLVKNESQPVVTIYAITPTYKRTTQKADLIRLLHTVMNIPNFHWIVVEDSFEKTKLVTDLLKKSKMSYTHLNARSRRMPKKDQSVPRGIDQRNAGLSWVRNYVSPKKGGILYFMDDDNTYSLELFDEMRSTKVASCWLVGFAGGLEFEGPGECKDGKIVSWYSVFAPKREFRLDMAGFSINLNLIFKFFNVVFSYSWGAGRIETIFLTKLQLSTADMEAKGNCSKVWVWHTKTQMPIISKNRAKLPKELLKSKKDVEF